MCVCQYGGVETCLLLTIRTGTGHRRTHSLTLTYAPTRPLSTSTFTVSFIHGWGVEAECTLLPHTLYPVSGAVVTHSTVCEVLDHHYKACYFIPLIRILLRTPLPGLEIFFREWTYRPQNSSALNWITTSPQPPPPPVASKWRVEQRLLWLFCVILLKMAFIWVCLWG